MTSNNAPLVSVLIACYNHEAYIQEIINAILSQNYPNYELIVIDDGSSDLCPEILGKLSKQHRFTFIAQKNQGVTATLNRLMSLASGTYICATSSDDPWLPEKLTRQVNFLEAHSEFNFCAGQAVMIDARGNILPQRSQTFWVDQDSEFTFVDLFMGRVGISGPSIMFRSSTLREVGYYDPKFRVDDFYILLKLTSLGHRFKILAFTTNAYRIHNTNAHANLKLMYVEMNKILDLYASHPLYSKAKRYWHFSFFSSMATSQKYEALKMLPSSFEFSLPFLKAFIKLFVPAFIWLKWKKT